MKKILIIFIAIILVFSFSYIYAADTIDLEFKVLDNKKNEKFDLYILLPKEYILFAIEESKLELEYDGVNTIKKNEIPGIKTEKQNIQDEIYEGNGIEYIQIRLEKKENIYQFELLENYPKTDIKFRIKNIQKDYIVHIDNFKIENGKCEIEYNYAKDIVKQPDKKVMTFSTKLLIILLIIVIIVGIIAYRKGKR